MIKSSIEKIAEDIGFDIAQSDDLVQSKLLNGLGRGFKLMNSSDLARQLSYLTDNLSSDAEYILKELCEYIKLKNGSR